MNTFKIFLSDNVEVPLKDDLANDSEKFGPPGEAVFLEKVKADLGDIYTDQAGKWAVKILFSLIIHFGVILNTTVMKVKCKDDVELTPDFIEKDIRRSVRAHLSYVRANPEF